MQPVAACRRVFHQMAVAKRERIRIHDNRPDILAGPALTAQRTAVARNALRRVLHQYRVIATAGDRPEAAAGKALLVTGPGAEEEMKMAAREGDVFHFRQQPRAEIHTAQLLIDRHAFDNVGGQPHAAHQLLSGPGLNEQRDIVVHPQTAVRQQVTNLAQTFRVLGHFREAKVDSGLRVHHHALLNVPSSACWLALP